MKKTIMILLVPTIFLVSSIIYHSIGRLPDAVFSDRIGMVANLYFVSIVYSVFRNEDTGKFWAILGIGLTLNHLAVLTNGGMPGNHVLITENTKWLLFSDIIPIGNLFIISAGDILIIAGLTGFFGAVCYEIYDTIRKTRQKQMVGVRTW